MSLKIGVVVEVHPGDNSVDLVMTDTGARLVGIQVLATSGSTRTGTADIPKIPERENKWDITRRTGQDLIAVVGFFGDQPVVLGFLYPQINQMLFDDPLMRIFRHQSDVYQTIDGNGNIELRHPSGAFIRIAESPESVDLTGKNTDGNFKVDRNLDRPVYLRVELAGNVAQLTMSPEGECTLKMEKSFLLESGESIDFKCEGDFNVECGGNFGVDSGGQVDVKSADGTTIDAGGNMALTAPRIDFN